MMHGISARDVMVAIWACLTEILRDADAVTESPPQESPSDYGSESGDPSWRPALESGVELLEGRQQPLDQPAERYRQFLFHIPNGPGHHRAKFC